MLRKLKTFWGSSSKGLLIKEKILSFFQYLKYSPRFGHFGRGTILYKPDRIIGKKDIFIGENVRILHHARMEVFSEWHGQKLAPQVQIGKEVNIGQNFHLACAGKLVIGNRVIISGNVLITDLEHGYQETDEGIYQQDLLVKETRIGEDCFIGYGAAIQAGSVLGKHCIVGTNAVVRGVFDDYSVIAGVPAKMVKRYDSELGQWVRVSGGNV